MSALETIQISTNTLRETLKGENRGGEGDGKAFLRALLDSEYAADGEITGEELVRFLRSRGGKDLPVLGELLPEMLELEAADRDMPQPATGNDGVQDPEQIVAGLLAMIEGPQRTEARMGGSAGLEGFLKGGGDKAMNAAQLREALIQGMAASPMAEAEAAEGRVKLDDFQTALNRFSGPALTAGGQPAAEPAAARSAPALQINTPPGQPGWGQAVGEKVVWMVRQEVQQARIQLNPPGMGPLDISVNIQDDKASITFTAQHAVTREALQAELPRLRTMMNDQGFDAVDVNVAQDSDAQGYQTAESGTGGESGRGQGETDDEGDEGALESGVAALIGRAGNGLIDHYA